MDWLQTISLRSYCKEGDVLFKKGDLADTMFYPLSGRFLLAETGIEILPGQLVGEIGLVSPENGRTQTLKCIEAGELLSIGYDRVKELYFQNPQFGFYFLNLIAQRLIANNATLEQKLKQIQPNSVSSKDISPGSDNTSSD